MFVLSQPPDAQSGALAVAVVNSWIMVDLIEIAERKGRFTSADIDGRIASMRGRGGVQRYSGTTIGRRQTIIAWLRWLASEMGCIAETSDGYMLQ